jgi:hypothetical protein
MAFRVAIEMISGDLLRQMQKKAVAKARRKALEEDVA